jgi:hypothetical protein
MTACQYIPVVADAGGNTLLCHYEHALNALATDAGGNGLPVNPHCWHAGPYGWGVCGNQCEDFCTIATTYCEPDAGFSPDSGAPPYPSFANCAASCANFASVAAVLDAGPNAILLTDAGPSSFSSNGPTSGNTRDCREYHLGAALTSPGNQQIHCPHPADASAVCF